MNTTTTRPTNAQLDALNRALGKQMPAQLSARNRATFDRDNAFRYGSRCPRCARHIEYRNGRALTCVCFG